MYYGIKLYRQSSYGQQGRYNNLKERQNMHTDRFGNTFRQKCRAKEAEKELNTRVHV